VRQIVSLLEQKNLRQATYVIIGGGATEQSLVSKFAIDGQTRDAYDGLRLIKAWVGRDGKEAVA
ncbi:MAG: hypothetical protein HN348_33885, partial [Proteobacteria bacterium]|nr:hypothetical protein [Pseudomonadota bacterium]